MNPHSNLYPAADWSVIDSLVNKYMSKPISTCFRVLGFVVWFGQKWLDTIRIKQHKLNNHCFHPHIFCKHGIDFIKSTSTCDRPFLDMENIIRENDRITQVSDQTEQWLCTIGLKLMSVMSADRTSKPILPKSYGQYTMSKVFFNDMYVQVFYGRSIRWCARLEPTQHQIRLLSETSPLMSLVLQHSHLTIGCGFGIQRYMRHVRFSGFTCVNLQNAVAQHIKFCNLCPLVKTILT